MAEIEWIQTRVRKHLLDVGQISIGFNDNTTGVEDNLEPLHRSQEKTSATCDALNLTIKSMLSSILRLFNHKESSLFFYFSRFKKISKHLLKQEFSRRSAMLDSSNQLKI